MNSMSINKPTIFGIFRVHRKIKCEMITTHAPRFCGLPMLQYDLHVLHAEVWKLMENNKDSIRMHSSFCVREEEVLIRTTQ